LCSQYECYYTVICCFDFIEKENMTSSIEYHLPPVGTVQAILHNESERLVNHLREVSELDRLKKLDHLGIVRLVSEGAHHPRWEYVILMLHLIEKCRNNPRVHLSRTLTLPASFSCSSTSELLKVWSILLNVGHLPWTFTAERALLLEVWRDRGGARKEFLDLLNQDGLGDWADKILRKAPGAPDSAYSGPNLPPIPVKPATCSG